MGVAPAEFPPPVDPAADYVTEPTDPEDERIEVGVAIVGGGPAGLACAIKTTRGGSCVRSEGAPISDSSRLREARKRGC